MSYEQWNDESKTNIRLLPEYGHVTKTDAQIRADKEFIEATIKQNGSKEKASAKMVDLGFQYYYRGDIKTAMYRFNQAWLLDPVNENAYWGFAAVYFHFNDYDKAIAMHDKGLALNPKNTNLLTDKATVYLARLNDKYDEATLKMALELFNRSYAIDPKNVNTTFKLSTVYFSLNDCGQAKRYYDECKENGGDPITEEYTKALKENCK